MRSDEDRPLVMLRAGEREVSNFQEIGISRLTPQSGARITLDVVYTRIPYEKLILIDAIM
jgi:hypothetical protein